MAGDPSESRTETATTRRREEARKQGQVALSQELNSAILLLVGLTLLSWTIGDMATQFQQLLRYSTRFQEFTQWSSVETHRMALRVLGLCGQLLGAYVAGILLIGVGANIGQIGFRVQTEVLSIKWDRLSPAKGYQKLFSMRSAIRGLWGILKLVCILSITFYLAKSKIPEMRSVALMLSLIHI